MNELSKDAVSWVTVGDDAEGQRIDNFLLRTLKGVPKSHIYRILRSGEVRLNKGRVGPDARLAQGDVVRVPPVRTAAPARIAASPAARRFGPAIVHALLAEMDEPILSSTLILPGEEHALNDATVIEARLGGRIEAIVDAGPCPASPTTVVDLAVAPPVIVRRGLGDPARLGLAADDGEAVEVN